MQKKGGKDSDAWIVGSCKKIGAHYPHKHDTGHESAKCTICDEYIVNGSTEAISKHKSKTGHSAEFAGNPPPYVYERSIKNLLKYLIELVTNAYELEKQELESWVNLRKLERVKAHRTRIQN